MSLFRITNDILLRITIQDNQRHTTSTGLGHPVEVVCLWQDDLMESTPLQADLNSEFSSSLTRCPPSL